MNKDIDGKELERINEELKKAEELTLPESLNEQNTAARLKEQEAQAREAQSNRKKSSMKLVYKRAIALAATFAIVFSVLFAVKPWKNRNVVTPPSPDNTTKKSEAIVRMPESEMGYAELEELFVAYHKANKVSLYDRIVGKSFDYAAGSNAEVAPGVQAAAEGNTSGEAYGDDSGSAEHGETNEQVQGVNEADIIKNDGKYLYMTLNTDNYYYANYYADYSDSDGRKPFSGVAIIKPAADGSMTLESIINVDTQGDDYNYRVQNMYVKGDRLIVIYGVYDRAGGYGWNGEKTAAVCFDITDRSAPVEAWRFFQSGSVLSTRLVENQLVLLTNYYVSIYNDDENVIAKNCIPESGSSASDCERIPEENICVMDNLSSPSYLVVANIDITRPDLEPASAAILGGGNNIYCTTNTLYVTNAEYDYTFADSISGFSIARADVAFVGSADSSTTLYSFDISDGNVIFNADTTLKGTVLNQFSIDEYNGNLRIATTTGNFADANNYLYVLDLALNTVGTISDIEKGESIKSVRFMGDRGYIVTFLQTDPLFVIDLSVPTEPKILGELKITGFSSYLHPITSTLLAGIGPDGTDEGANNKLKVSLFDVSDPENPVEADKFVYGTDSMYVSSEACLDHKAICWNANEGIFYFPISANTYYTYSDISSFFASIIGLKINTEANKFDGVSEYKYTPEKSIFPDFVRSTYIDSTVFAFSVRSVVSYDKSSMEMLSELSFEGYDFPTEFTPKNYVPDTTANTDTTEVTAPVTANDITTELAPDTTLPQTTEVLTDTTTEPEVTASADTTAIVVLPPDGGEVVMTETGYNPFV